MISPRVLWWYHGDGAGLVNVNTVPPCCSLVAVVVVYLAAGTMKRY